MTPRRQAGFARSEETVGVFARVPASSSRKLSRTALELGRPKQEVLATLVDRYADLLGEDIAVGRASVTVEPSEVLTPDEAADLLRIDVETLLALAEKGEVPGRKLGGEWRFSRQALLDWLSSSR
jgi:excisionase family DNA binding protein